MDIRLRHNIWISRIIDEKTGYLRLTSFNENSSDQIKDKIKEFNKNKKIENGLQKKVIF